MKKYLLWALFSLAFTLVFYSCAVNPVTGKKQLNLMGEDQEKALGASSDPQIIASFGLYPDEKIQKFITDKGLSMARISHRPELDYKFRILDSEVVNAFAVPGGYVYFTRGIMAHFNNEAEFAGVLGHEIGHITARHSARQYSSQMLAQGLFLGGMIASKELRNYADVLSQGLGLLFLKYSRDHESESDELGVAYSTEVGYDSHYMADFFNTIHRISAGAGQSIPTFMSTHPDPLNRYQRVHQLTDKAQAAAGSGKQYRVNRDAYLRMIDGIVYGPDPRQGFVENNMFYHPELKFQFPVPRGWRHQNSPMAFVMGPEDGKAIMQLTLAQEKTLEEAGDAILQKYKLTLRDSRKATLNGMPALIFVADQVPQQQEGQTQQQQQQQQVVRVLTYLVQYNGLIYVQQGITTDKDYNKYKPAFENVGSNFKTLTDPNKLNRQPERVRIKQVQQSGTLQQALAAMKMPSSKYKELAIVNGMELNKRVEKGTLLKTIGK